MPDARWTDPFLDTRRERCDPVADAVVDAIYDQGRVEAVNRLMVQLVKNAALPPQALPEPVRDFFARTTALPRWADPAQLARAAALFGRQAHSIMLILGHYALPACYAARKGVQVLHMTARLSRNPRPRLLETAQLVCDVMAPDGLSPGGLGIRSAQKVRLMHAAVRRLILQTGWNTEFGLPINQEDMIGTLLTFSYVTLDGLKKLGCAIDPDDADAYMHAWNVVGAVMGVDEALLPRDTADAEALLLAIQRRHFEPCPEGRQLTRALVEMLQESTRGSPFERLPVSTMRYLLGDQIGGVLGLPTADWTRELILPMRMFNRVTSEAQARLPLLPQLAETFGCQVIDGLMRMNRGGNRADFRLPTALQG